jgi:hypothetical protein
LSVSRTPSLLNVCGILNGKKLKTTTLEEEYLRQDPSLLAGFKEV